MAHNTFSPIIVNGLIFCIDPISTKSYIGSGTSSYDIKNQQVGNLMNGVGFDGVSFSFDGVDDIIDFGPDGTAGQLRGSSEFTLSVWVRKDSSGSDTIFSAYDGNTLEGWFLQWFSDDNIYCGVRNGSLGLNYYTLPWTDDWYNIVLVYDGSQLLDVDKTNVFVNGVSVTMINSGTIESTVPTTLIDMIFGGAVNYTGYSQGRSSTVIIYNRKLLSNEVLYNYNAQKNRFI